MHHAKLVSKSKQNTFSDKLKATADESEEHHTTYWPSGACYLMIKLVIYDYLHVAHFITVFTMKNKHMFSFIFL